FGAGIERGFHDGFFGGARRKEELTTVVEHEGDRAILAQVATVLAERVSHLGYGAGPIVGHAVDDHRGAADTVTFVANFFVIGIVRTARAALDRALDVVLGHVGIGGLVPGEAEARVGIR